MGMVDRYQTNSVVNVRARSRAIGRELRRHLDHVVMERVPDDMVALLRQIDAKVERGEIRPYPPR